MNVFSVFAACRTRSMLPVAFLSAGLTFPPPLRPIAVAEDPKPPDQAVEIDVRHQLHGDARLREAEIDVRVAGGVVTLQGEVATFLERMRAERLGKQVHGVTSVNNRIRVVCGPVDDAALVGDVQHRLAGEPRLRSADVTVVVDDSTVTLTGEVESWADRRRAEMVVRRVNGVLRIHNELTVVGTGGTLTSQDQDAVLTAKVRETLDASSLPRHSPIKVQVRDWVVTLEGEVATTGQRRLYRELVARVPGVRRVQNQLTVRDAPQTVADDDLQSPARRAEELQLMMDAMLDGPGESANVTLAGGQIRLDGVAENLSRKRMVLRAAQRIAAAVPLTGSVVVAKSDSGDAAIEKEIRHRLRTDSLLSDQRVDVSFSDGILTLTGHVDQFVDKRRATQLVAQVAGVHELQNELEVNWTRSASDREIADRIRSRLRRNRRTAASVDSVQITVSDGHVKVSGQVDHWAVRMEVGQIASHTDGIRSLDNQLTVTTR